MREYVRDVVARLRALAAQGSLLGDGEVLGRDALGGIEIPRPRLDVREVREHVRDRGQVPGAPRLLEQGGEPSARAVEVVGVFQEGGVTRVGAV